jgi:hypothetical protein
MRGYRLQNYFNYFTEIEEHFQSRRGSLLLLSTLDWALIETWQEAGIPLEVALRGMDEAFDKREAKQRNQPNRRIRLVNGLAWCAQAVMEAAEQQREAAIGTAAATGADGDAEGIAGFEAQRIAEHLETAAQALDASSIALEAALQIWAAALAAIALRLREIAEEIIVPSDSASGLNLENLERQLTVLEEKLFASLTTHVPEEVLLQFKREAARDLSAYRSRMGAVQLKQIEQQFVHKRLLEHYKLPRLSLFYMRQT